VGVYDPRSGVRLPLENGEDALIIGPLRMTTPPPPDQTCALIPQSCAAQ